MRYFAFENVAREAGISDDRLQELCRATRREFLHDDMMYELHVLRACMAVRDGLISLEAALAVGSGSKECSPRRTL
jgi:hypothetical protein